jgi:dsDNA-specific endonuclease/ATPase MutS2
MVKDKYFGSESSEETAVEIPINGTLDLHTFAPRDVKDLVPTYLDACLERGITEVRIIHGKGKGVLRRIVRAALERYPNTVSYRYGGSWGVTVVRLERR